MLKLYKIKLQIKTWKKYLTHLKFSTNFILIQIIFYFFVPKLKTKIESY
jgi:hypothetical protein